MQPPLQTATEKYLASDYGKPDREFVHGEVIERTMPDFEHGRVQGLLGSLLPAAKPHRRLVVACGVRLRIGPDLVRIPDVLVYPHPGPKERFPSTPPLVVAEIVSEDDRYLNLMAKLEEHAAFGVEHIWIVEPARRLLRRYRPDKLETVSSFDLPDYNVHITPADLFDVS